MTDALAAETFKLAILMRNGGAVKRYHTVRTLREQTIVEHSGGVAMLVLCVQPNPSAALLTAALMHDMAEVRTGDLPATVKWEHPGLGDILEGIEVDFNREFHIPEGEELTEHEVHVLKFCDSAELVFWCMEEQALGNNFIGPLIKRGLDRMKQLPVPTPEAQNVLDYLVYASSGDLEDMVTYDGK